MSTHNISKCSSFSFNPNAQVFEPGATMASENTTTPITNPDENPQLVPHMDNNPLDPDLLQKVLSIDLVFDNLTSFLSHKELKKMSQLSKFFFGRVRVCRIFNNNSKYLIDGQSYDDPLFNVNKKESKFIWKNVRIQVDDFDRNEVNEVSSKKMNASIQNRLMDVEFVFLEEIGHYLSIRDRETEILEIPLIRTILTRTPRLQFLTLSPSILTKDLTQILSKKRIIQCLENLEELHFTDDYNSYNNDNDGSGIELEKNLTILASVKMKLKSFTWGMSNGHPKESIPRIKNVVRIVQGNQQTLTTLTLKIYIWRFDELSNEIFCPNLKNLNICARYKDGNIVKRFLEKHGALLESLDMEFVDWISQEISHPRIFNNMKNLKKLIIKSPSFEDSDRDNFMDWSFLSGLAHLEEFQTRIKCNELLAEATCPQLLQALPPTLKKLNVRSLRSEWNSWVCECFCETCHENPRHCKCTKEQHVCNFISRIQTMSRRLERFTNLIELSLLNTKSRLNDPKECVVDDEVLQFICLTLTDLKVFRISYCPEVTDFGLTGIRLDDGFNSQISLHNLKGLHELMIKGCQGVSDYGLVLAVKFPQLIHVNLTHRKPRLTCLHEVYLYNQSLIQIVEQNPRLESIVIFSRDMNTTSVLMTANPKLDSIHNTCKPKHMFSSDSGTVQCKRKSFELVRYSDPFSDNDDDEYKIDDDKYESKEDLLLAS